MSSESFINSKLSPRQVGTVRQVGIQPLAGQECLTVVKETESDTCVGPVILSNVSILYQRWIGIERKLDEIRKGKIPHREKMIFNLSGFFFMISFFIYFHAFQWFCKGQWKKVTTSLLSVDCYVLTVYQKIKPQSPSNSNFLGTFGELQPVASRQAKLKTHFSVAFWLQPSQKHSPNNHIERRKTTDKFFCLHNLVFRECMCKKDNVQLLIIPCARFKSLAHANA